MIFQDCLELERQELIRAFDKDLLPPVIAVREIDLLLTNPVLNGERLIPVSGIRKGNAYAWFQNGISSCWVRASYGNYRTAYLKYANEFLGFDESKLPQDFDIDHLFNQSRGLKHKEGFLRIFPVAKNINRSHGVVVEGRLTKTEKKRDIKLMHFMTFFAILKILGVKVPKNKEDSEKMEIAVNAITATGNWSHDVVYQALLNLLDRLNSPQDIITIKVKD